MPKLFDNRLAWSGEWPVDASRFGLEMRLLMRSRFSETTSSSRQYVDEAGGHTTAVRYVDADASSVSETPGYRGDEVNLNTVNPASQRSYYIAVNSGVDDIWPTSGVMVMGLWLAHNYTMAFNPYISTRENVASSGAGEPLAYLSTYNTGRLRHQVYDADGALILDQGEDAPWGAVFTPQWVAQVVDLDNRTSQVLTIDYEGDRAWASPVRSIDGIPNAACEKSPVVFGLPIADYYTGGQFDEFFVARADSETWDPDAFLDLVHRSIGADAQRLSNADELDVTDEGVTRSSGGGFGWYTSAERLRWQRKPSYPLSPGEGHTVRPETSTDGGATWDDSSTASENNLPEEFDGLVRFYVYSRSGAGAFDGIEFEIPEADPLALAAIDDQHVDEGDTVTVGLDATGGIAPITFSAVSTDPSVASVAVEGAALTLRGLTVGEAVVTATATDDDGQDASQAFSVTVAGIVPDPPVIDVPSSVALDAGAAEVIDLTATGTGALTWSAEEDDPDGVINVMLEGSTLTIGAGFDAGSAGVAVTVTDSFGQSDSATISVAVTVPDAPDRDIPAYSRSPIIIGDDGDAAAIIDALSAVDIREVNGEQTFEFSVPVKHRHAGAIRNEQPVEFVGEPYRVRRVTTGRKQGAPVMEVYCEAAFYDLAYAGQISEREYRQTLPGDALADALAGTGWDVATVNVSTRRTYTIEDRATPLEMLRTIQSNHGGDLVFNNRAKTVSLLVRSGADAGVSFLYGRGLTESQRVVDTTSLVTRIYARNADGVTIAAVNGGRAYVEDFTYTDEVREATYNFAAGTSPYRMLSMVNATLANRSKPSYSYEFTVADLSYRTGQEVDRFDVGDTVTVVDDELGIREAQRIVKVERDIVRPDRTTITLSGKLRELGSSSSDEDENLSTGSQASTFDLVPFNLLLNGRFDNGLNHWARQGVSVVENGQGTGDYSALFTGTGERWIEQTVSPDNRDAYTLSFDITSSGPQGWVPDVRAIAVVEYDDGSEETIELELS